MGSDQRELKERLHVALVGPIATDDISDLVGPTPRLPRGYPGAPILGTLARGLVSRGHQVSCITTDASLAVKDGILFAKGSKIDVYYCPQRAHAFRPKDRLPGRAVDGFHLERQFLVQAIRRARPSVVHAHWLYEFAWAAQQAQVPHLLTAHDSPIQVLKHLPNTYRAIRYVMARIVASRARTITTVSPYMATELRRITAVPVHVVPNPLPYELSERNLTLKDQSLNAGSDSSNRRLAMILNGWDKRKNTSTGLRAFAMIRDAIKSAELHIFGFGAEALGAPARWAEDQGLHKSVHFRGHVPHRDLIAELPNFELLLHPALEESFGMALIEAMAVGVPVVAGATSGAVPWVVANGGRMVDVRSPIAIASVSIDLLQDNESLRKLSRDAHHNAQRFAPSKVLASYEHYYQRVISPGM